MTNNVTKQRKFKVFISSTFRDMNTERDYLNTYVFPRIHQYCSERFIEFNPIDLRWGIREEDSKNGMVLSTCLDEIDDARPFFIGIIGSRYGWIPTEKEMQTLRNSIKNQEPWLLSMINNRASITEIEMEYGALRNKDLARACFMMRAEEINILEEFKDPLGSIEYQKLLQLKRKISAQNKYPVYHYSSIQEFGEIIYKELMSNIKLEFPPTNNDYEESIICRHEYVLNRRSESYCSLASVFLDCNKWVQSNEQILLILGNPGYGTSTCLANIVTYLRNSYVSPIIYYDFEEAILEGDVIERFFRFIALKRNNIKPTEWGLIALDNCAILTQTEVCKLSQWVSNLSHNVHVIIATSYGSASAPIFRYIFCSSSIMLHGFTEQQRKEYIINYLRRYGKRIDETQLDYISKIKKTEDPTYLSYLLNDLVNFGSFENLNEHLSKLIAETSSAEMYSIWNEIKKLYKDTHLKLDGQFASAMALLAQMQGIGISEKELCAILGITTSHWAILRTYVTKWCKGNKTRLMFVKPEWSHAITQIWSTPWLASIGVQAIEWFLKNKDAVTAATAISSIWNYIGYLPIAEGVGENKYQEIKKQILTLASSPDVVLQLDVQHLTSLFDWNSTEIQIEVCESFYGSSPLDDLSFINKERYYLRLIKVAKNLNRGSLEAYCYNMLSKETNKICDYSKKFCYEALAFLAKGCGAKAIELLKPLVSRNEHQLYYSQATNTNEEKHESVMALSVYLQACCMCGDKNSCIKYIGVLYNQLKENSDDSKIMQSNIFDTIIDILYLLSYTKSHTQQTIEIYNAIKNIKEDYCSFDQYAKLHICGSILWLYESEQNNEKCYEYSYKYSCAAEQFAYLAGRHLLQSQAAIIGDYIYFKVQGQYRPGPRQIYKNCYNPPLNFMRTFKSHRNRNVEWDKIDIEVRKSILKERDFYKELIFEMQPEFERRKMCIEDDALKKEMHII